MDSGGRGFVDMLAVRSCVEIWLLFESSACMMAISLGDISQVLTFRAQSQKSKVSMHNRLPQAVHGFTRCTLRRDFTTTSTRYYSTNMDLIEAALKDLKLQDTKNISAVAKLHGVDRSTLSRRFNGVANPRNMAAENMQLLRPQQEQELVEYINTLTRRGTLLTPAMVRNFAGDIAGKRPGRSWSHRFCIRYNETLLCRYLKNIDISRKKAEHPSSIKAFYDLTKQKTEEYGILPANTYNMDEKGFMLRVSTKQRRNLQ